MKIPMIALAGLAATSTVVGVSVVGCASNKSSTTSSSGSATSSGSNSATSSSSSAQSADYTGLLIKASDITLPGDTFTAQPPIQNPNGQPGVATVFSNQNDTRKIGDDILILPDADTAVSQLDEEKAALGNMVTGGTPAPLSALHQWPRPTDLPRARCVGSGLDSTPGTGVEPQWNATIRTTRGVGRLFDSLKLSAWQLAPSWLPHCRGRWPDSGKQGRAPLLSGPTVPE